MELIERLENTLENNRRAYIKSIITNMELILGELKKRPELNETETIHFRKLLLSYLEQLKFWINTEREDFHNDTQ